MNAAMLYRIAEVIGDRKRDIKGVIPMGRTAWYKGIKEGRYPRPVKISERSVAWKSEDIDALVARISSGVWDKSINQ